MRAGFMCKGRSGLFLALVLCAACGPAPRREPQPDNEESVTADEVQEEYRAAAHSAFVKGSFLREQGDLEGALQQYADATRLAPHDAAMRLAFAELQIEAGRIREATEFLQASVRRFGGSADERLLLVRLRAASGARDTALAEVGALLKREPKLVAAWLLQGQLLLDAKRFDAARESVRRADRLEPGQAAAQEALGDAERGLEHAADAERAYRAALSAEPARRSAREKLVALLQSQGRTSDIESFYRDTLRRDPDDAAALDALLELLLEGSDVTRAEELLQPYQRRGALSPQLTLLYGRILLQMDRAAAADSVLRPLASGSDVHGVETLLGDIAVRMDRLGEAKQHYRKAMQQQPDDCAAYVSMALLQVDALRDAKGRVRLQGAAGRDLEKALQAAEGVTDSTEYRCNRLLGVAYSQARQYGPAVRHLERARRLQPRSAELLFDLATALQEQGRGDSAVAVARAVLEVDPENAPALNFIGYILAERGRDLEHSETLIRRALAKEPKNGYYVDSLGWVLYQKGDYARAATELERAVQLTDEHDATILEHLGDAYLKLGRLDGAFRVYRQSKRLEPDNPALGSKIGQVQSQMRRP